jgi:LacI family transcriptional regulator
MTRPIRIGIVMTHGYSYFRDILLGIRRYAETQPRWIFTTVAAEPPALKAFAEFKPDGLIASIDTPGLKKALAAMRRPVVNIAAVLRQPLPFPRVGVDNAEVGRLAAQHFLERGLRHFAFVGNPQWLYSIAREAAFRATLEQSNASVVSYHDDVEHSFDPRGQQRPLDRRVHRWLLALPKPIGIFTPNDLWGVRVTEVCRQKGLRVPEDVAVLGVDDDDLYCELARPPLSSVIVPAERIGYEAAALLERMLEGEKAPAEPILLPPPGVVTRRSTEVLAIDDPHVTAAVRYIREHAHLPVQVSDVFEQVPVGRRWLERAFRKVLGRGVWEEIRRVHVERARRLLTETHLSIEAVAIQSGFSDFRHLAVVFRKELGVSPTAYRRQMGAAAG